MSTPYDLIADEYDQSMQLLPIRMYVEAHSVLKMLADVRGCEVLDVACGTGFYARVVRRAGASRVLGIDLSPEMIRVAETIENRLQLGIEFKVGDAAQLQVMGAFDRALGVYLLQYAPTLESLQAMCQGIANNLKPGGRFVSFVLNPEIANMIDACKRYGLVCRVPDPVPDGCKVHFRIETADVTTPEFIIYRWSAQTLETALTAAGFHDIKWARPEVSHAGVEKHGLQMWQDYLERPHCLLLECRKS